MATALRDTMYEIETDASIRSVVLEGAGRGFMAGGDVAGFHEELDKNLQKHVGAMLDDYHCAVRAMVRMEKPVVGALHGPVAGGRGGTGQGFGAGR